MQIAESIRRFLAVIVETDSEENMDRRVWHKKPLGVLLVYGFLCLLAFWNLHIPSPGEAVAALAVAAAVMTLLGEMRGKEKLAWILILFGFLDLELTSIKVERTAQEEVQKQARAEQLRHFNDIGGGIQASIAKSDRNFSATMSGINQNIKVVTGGNSFCYMRFSSDGIGASGVPTFVHIGKFPLTDVSARIVDLNNFVKRTAQGITSLEQFMAGDIKVPIGDLATNTAFLNPLLKIPFSDRNSQDFRIFYDAKNGHWMQDLELRNVNGKWLQALRVRRQIGNETPTAFHQTDKGFPLDKNGKVEWPQ